MEDWSSHARCAPHGRNTERPILTQLWIRSELWPLKSLPAQRSRDICFGVTRSFGKSIKCLPSLSCCSVSPGPRVRHSEVRHEPCRCDQHWSLRQQKTICCPAVVPAPP